MYIKTNIHDCINNKTPMYKAFYIRCIGVTIRDSTTKCITIGALQGYALQ